MKTISSKKHIEMRTSEGGVTKYTDSKTSIDSAARSARAYIRKHKTRQAYVYRVTESLLYKTRILK